MNPADGVVANGPAAPRGAVRGEVWTLIALGVIVGLACRGHFAMPFADFFEFVDSGHALWAGHLPATLKRAPLYPLLVVGLSHLVPGATPELTVAEWLNVLLLPLNAWLVYAIARTWIGGAARWAAAWFLLLPWGVYCTAHVIAEPLLTTGILATVRLAQLGSGWAYVAAALATMVRYDAAGLIPGLLAADLLCRRPCRGAIVRTVAATLPLVLWLLLTVVTWQGHAGDHYLVHLQEERHFAVWTAAGRVTQTVVDPDLVRLPAVLEPLQIVLHGLLRYGPLVLAVLGAVMYVRRRAGEVLAALITLALYVAVHALYPFDTGRFGYPVAALWLLLAVAGLEVVARRWRRWDPALRVGHILVGLAAAALLAMLSLIAGGAELVTVNEVGFARRAGVWVLLGALGVWAVTLLPRGRRLTQGTLLLAVVTGVIVQVRAATGLIGSGQDLRNEVVAAQWVRTHLPADARVLSATPGLLRLYVGRTPADRFVHFAEIQAENWPDILAECRQRGIAYIIWHDQLGPEHGSYYHRWRLERFDPLATPESAAGVEAVRYFPGHPHVVIVRVLDT